MDKKLRRHWSIPLRERIERAQKLLADRRARRKERKRWQK
jgi:hypothetical protein